MNTGLQVKNASNEVVITTSGRSLFVVAVFGIGAGTGWWDWYLPNWCRYMSAGWTLVKHSAVSGEVPQVTAHTNSDGYPYLNFSPTSANCTITVFAW
jgi:hypothetical protein